MKPDLSRYAVMQHLSVLEKAGIMLVRRKGRERWNELNAVPIQRELERWLNVFQQAAGEGIQWHGSLDTFADQLHAWIDRGEVIPPPETT